MYICSYLLTPVKEDCGLQFSVCKATRIVLSVRSRWKLSTTQRTNLSQQEKKKKQTTLTMLRIAQVMKRPVTLLENAAAFNDQECTL